MNILEAEDLIKGSPDQTLLEEAQNPTGQVPQYLVMSEIQRRTDMRKRFETEEQQPTDTVAEQIMAESMGGSAPPPMAPQGAPMPPQNGMPPQMPPQMPPAPPQMPPAPVSAQMPPEMPPPEMMPPPGALPVQNMAHGGPVTLQELSEMIKSHSGRSVDPDIYATPPDGRSFAGDPGIYATPELSEENINGGMIDSIEKAPNAILEDARKFRMNSMENIPVGDMMAMSQAVNMGIPSVLPMSRGGVVRMQTGAQVELDPSRYQGSPKDLLTAAELAATGMMLFPEPTSTAAGAVLRAGTTAARWGPTAYRAAKSFGPRVVGQAKTAIKELPEDILTALGRRISGGKLPTSGTSPGLPIPPRYRPSSSSFADIGRQAIANLKLGKRGAGLGILGLIEGIRRGGGERPQPQPERSMDFASEKATREALEFSRGGIVKMQDTGPVQFPNNYDAALVRQMLSEKGIDYSLGSPFYNQFPGFDTSTSVSQVQIDAIKDYVKGKGGTGGLSLFSSAEAANAPVSTIEGILTEESPDSTERYAEMVAQAGSQPQILEDIFPHPSQLENILSREQAFSQLGENLGGVGGVSEEALEEIPEDDILRKIPELDAGIQSEEMATARERLTGLMGETISPYDPTELLLKAQERADKRVMSEALIALGAGIAGGDVAAGLRGAGKSVSDIRSAQEQFQQETEMARGAAEVQAQRDRAARDIQIAQFEISSIKDEDEAKDRLVGRKLQLEQIRQTAVGNKDRNAILQATHDLAVNQYTQDRIEFDKKLEQEYKLSQSVTHRNNVTAAVRVFELAAIDILRYAGSNTPAQNQKLMDDLFKKTFDNIASIDKFSGLSDSPSEQIANLQDEGFSTGTPE